MASTMSETEHMGWQIESRSCETDGGRWCPRALVSRFDAGRLCRHDARALLSVTSESVRDADDYAVRVAKTWIEDRDRDHPFCHATAKLTGWFRYGSHRGLSAIQRSSTRRSRISTSESSTARAALT